MAMTVSKMAEYYTLGITVLMVNHKTDEKGSTWMWWYLSHVNDSYLQTAQITDSIRTYHSSVLGRPSLRSAMLEVESGLEEVARGLQWFGCNLSTGGIPAGKSAERFLKVKVLRIRKPLIVTPVDRSKLSCRVKSRAKAGTRAATRRRRWVTKIIYDDSICI